MKKEVDMIVILTRTIILYGVVLFMIRLMGKAELAEMEPFQLVIILMVAELAVLPMENTDISLMNGITALAALLFIQVLISYISLKSEKGRILFCGKPSILINKGNIVESEMKKLRININDLLEELRSNSITSLDDVEYAILETNGDLNVIPKAEARPLTKKDMLISSPIQHMSLPLIVDGMVYQDSLKALNLTEDWLKKNMESANINDYKEILFCYIDENDDLHFHRKQGNKGEVKK